MFEQRNVTADRGAFEPTLGILADGTAFYIAGDRDFVDVRVAGHRVVNQIARSVVFRSDDQGQTWRDISPRIQGFTTPPQTSDPFLTVDLETGRVFALDQTRNNCYWLIWSDDKGNTWGENPQACQAPVRDRPSIVAAKPIGVTPTGYSKTIFLCSAWAATTAGTGFSSCERSLDGGKSFHHVSNARSQIPRVGSPTCFEVYSTPVTTDSRGYLYLPRMACNQGLIDRSRDGGLTWETILVPTPMGASTDSVDLVLGFFDIGNDGRWYYVWNGPEGLPYFTHSGDEGLTWSPPVKVSRPDVTRTRFAMVVAGDAGRVAISYYGTTAPASKATSDDDTLTWNQYVGMSLNAADDNPVFATTIVNDPNDPVRRGSCAERCADVAIEGCRQCGAVGVADFLDLDMDPTTGRVWTTMVDVCSEKCVGGERPKPPQSRAAVGFQLEGTGLLSAFDASKGKKDAGK